ncbi:MAG: acetyl-CoA carboxylase biotin carboxyl carrier protein subunit [Gemmatimonadota bacterium]
MRYFVTSGDRTIEVDLSGDVPEVDGSPVRADLAAVPETPLRHLLADDRSHTLVAGAGAGRGAWEIHFDGHRYAVEVIDERTKAIREVTGGAEAHKGPLPVKAPMPGKVMRVEVEAGQSVEPGQGLVIVEAMKMENELKADAAAVVAKVHVSAGEAVEKGAVLVEFEAE